MGKYRKALPQLAGTAMLSDGGMETSLIFQDRIDLPCFASFVLMTSRDGRARLMAHYRRYLTLAARHGIGFILDTPTWRANADWGERLGYGAASLRAVNRAAVDLLLELRHEFEVLRTPCVISGAIGPRGDGSQAGTMTAHESQAYHAPQVEAFAASAADMVTAHRLSTVQEAVGITRAAIAAEIPCAISFTLEADGELPTGAGLGEAIQAVEDSTDGGPAYYTVNCAHPSHFAAVPDHGEPWLGRIAGVGTSSSPRSHTELARHLPGMRILGGCCGTDHRHVAAICDARLQEPV